MGMDVETIYIVDGPAFLSFERDDTPGCLILDLKVPGLKWTQCPAIRFGDDPDHLYFWARQCRFDCKGNEGLSE